MRLLIRNATVQYGADAILKGIDFEINDKNQLVPSVQFGVKCDRTDRYAGFDCTTQAISDKDYFKNLPK